ncbi:MULTISPECIES: DUF2771 family protein [unclassified Modestobacter]|uniref:DUF2771 family protein n=1 Tax=unclassified Modestobacter TaxID=2643866 RepID=UPI0022AADBC1|nr:MULTISPECIES: DUF2771 family protein [unclassified Modestobacter]MCZ2825279.1 DUF2771 family protein [Modestobacter sp. VKM Ac-2981]MCZ2853656.1 DUF2771 family protein [Modestobacter sp. VKM Ac-2982]
MNGAGRASGTALLSGVLLLAGCGDSGGTAAGGGEPVPSITVQAGGEEITVDPTQYCLDGEGQRYRTEPTYVEVAPDTEIVLQVPDVVADAGWSVQVFDQQLEERIGEIDVPAGTTVFDEISTSDVVPPTYYLVVVEDSDPDACSGLSGAWPVGFIRADGVAGTTTSPAG